MSFTPGHEAEDLAVVRRVLAGEINAYAILVERHAPGLAALTARHGPPDKAVEIANDTLVRAYENLKSFKGDKPFTHWLRKIAVNQCREYWRACNKRRETSLEPLDPDALSFVQSALDKVSLERFEDFTRGREAAELLEYALAHLKPEDRLVLSLTHLDEYDCAEAAEMLGWSVSKVKVRAHRARLKMREAIEKLLATGGEDARI